MTSPFDPQPHCSGSIKHRPAAVRSFFDAATYSYTHLVTDPTSGQSAIIDPVANFDPVSGAITTESADAIVDYVHENQLSVQWILETHVHADHLSAAPYLKALLGGQTGISSAVTKVQELLTTPLSMEPQFEPNGRQFDCLLDEGDELKLGELTLEVWHTPGHTPACATFVCKGFPASEDGSSDATDATPVWMAFVGDTLFMPDFGTGRTDFPGGCARTLYRSIQRVLSLPPKTTLYLCHDYGGEGREGYCCTTLVEEAGKNNIHLSAHATENAFVEFREQRDKKLSLPALFNAAVPYNLRGGQVPGPTHESLTNPSRAGTVRR